jgi:glyoxylase-like metal-dependent hydrolase (beta-lactamase superfamily II)
VYWLRDRASNFYLCQDEDGLTLVDTGLPKRQEVVWAALRHLSRQQADLVRILITHADIDHAGSAAVIQAESGAMVYTGATTAELLSIGKSPQHMPRLIQFVLDRFMGYPLVPMAAIQVVRDGDILPVLGGLHVLATPGHTLDHHSFFSPTTGVLFAGDALNTRDDRLQSTPKRITADETAARQSALRLLELTPSVIACGHGAPMSNPSSSDLMALTNALERD